MSEPRRLEGGGVPVFSASVPPLEALLQGGEPIRAPLSLARGGIDHDAEREWAAADPEGFWAAKAGLVEWTEPFGQVLRFTPPHHEWFLGGRLNATVSVLDRHVRSERRN